METPEGIQFAPEPSGRRSSTHAARAVFAAALAAADLPAAQALRAEHDWRTRYPRHLRALTQAGMASPVQAVTIARAGLAEAQRHVEFVRAGRATPLADALASARPDALGSVEIRGRGNAGIAEWTVPYRGRMLRGDALRAQIAGWQADGIVEPGHAQALLRVIDHPEWLDLSDRTLVLLGAGSEAGPLEWLSRWRANIVAVDRPDAGVWRRIVATVDAGNARLIAPARGRLAGDAPADSWLSQAGADLLTETPEIAAWLEGLDRPLDLAAIAYLDGERHVRVAMAMDALMARRSDARHEHTLMFMATPTDVFAVSPPVAEAAMQRWAQRSPTRRAIDAGLRALSGGRLMQPHVTGLQRADDGDGYGIVDCAVIEQGPNYALAKRLQQWRTVVARDAGQRVSLNVTPSTTTASVTHNRALKAGFDGAHLFGVEVFAPETTHALAAALWVHDLRCTTQAGDPATTNENPLLRLAETANHGGLWRVPYLPRSALPLAAIAGLLGARQH